ncbi:MAG: ATP-dependent helicase HrpB, partial [Myxococcota bacterium]
AATVADGALVLTAEPGAGKTTRLPPALLDALPQGRILVVEPRRVAARLAAEFVASERGEPVGQAVGYTVRDDNRTTATTRLIYLTGGVLMRRLTSDPTLKGVSCVIFDEFHERHLHDDVLVAWLRSLPNMRLVIMSATLDAGPIAAALGCQHLHSPGRTFPIELIYQEPRRQHLTAQVLRALKAAPAEGDILVFLPGRAAIERCATAAAGLQSPRPLAIIPLYASLGPKGVREALRPRPGQRRILLSTNIAESSVTLDGVRIVVDSGLVNSASTSPLTGLLRLEQVDVGRDSCDQRAGRAGRTEPGTCIRLFDEAAYRRREARALPEVARGDLTGAALLLSALGVQDPEQLQWLTPPDPTRWEAARDLLTQLGAVSASGITSEGRKMLRLPLHPRLARLVLSADSRGINGAGRLAATILEEDVRPRSDHSAGADMLNDVLNLVHRFERRQLPGPEQQRVSGGLRRLGGKPGRRIGPDAEEPLRRALLDAHPDLVGRRREGFVDLCSGRRIRLAQESNVRADWVVAVSADERFVRALTAIDPDWLYDLPNAEQSLDESVEVTWDGTRQRVMASLTIRFRGLSLEREEVDARGRPETETLLRKKARAAGTARFGDAKAIALLQSRTRIAHGADASIPHLDDSVLGETLDALCTGAISLEEVKLAGLLAALERRLEHRQRAQLSTLAPDRIQLSSGQWANVRYPAVGAARISARVQDFLGMSEGPRIGGRPALLELLAPNRQLIQLTDDLAGFWERTWPQVRKELRGRYARHHWPEDPTLPPPPRKRRPRK